MPTLVNRNDRKRLRPSHSATEPCTLIPGEDVQAHMKVVSDNAMKDADEVPSSWPMDVADYSSQGNHDKNMPKQGASSF